QIKIEQVETETPVAAKVDWNQKAKEFLANLTKDNVIKKQDDLDGTKAEHWSSNEKTLEEFNLIGDRLGLTPMVSFERLFTQKINEIIDSLVKEARIQHWRLEAVEFLESLTKDAFVRKEFADGTRYLDWQLTSFYYDE